jgi:hypothetical protein
MPSRAEASGDEWRIASHRVACFVARQQLLTLGWCKSGEGSRDRVSSDVTRFNSDNNWSGSRVSDQGLIGETEARLRVSSSWETTAEGSYLEKSWSCELKTSREQFSVECERIIAAVTISQFKLLLGVICEECFCEEKIYVWHLRRETVVASVLRAVAGRRLVET